MYITGDIDSYWDSFPCHKVLAYTVSKCVPDTLIYATPTDAFPDK